MTGRWASAALLLLPGALTVYLSFNAGGFFPNTPAFVALLLAAAMALRSLFSTNPLRCIQVAASASPARVALKTLALYEDVGSICRGVPE